MLAQPPDVRLVARQAGAVDAALLARADADALAAPGVADRIGLGVFESDQRDHKVALRVVGQGFAVGDDVLEKGVVDLELVAPLLKGDPEDVLVLDRRGGVIRIDSDDVVAALALGLQHFERLVGIAGRDDAVGHLARKQLGGLHVAGVGERDPVAVGGHAVGAARARVSARDRAELEVVHKVDLLFHLAQGQADRRPGGAHMLKGRRAGKPRRGFQLPHELPGVERVEEVDEAGLAVQDLDRQLALLHKDARGFLVGVAAVFQFQFLCHAAVLLSGFC